MAERKATNKYYPPEWDPSKGSINKFVGQHPLRERAKKLDQGILVVRFEMPFDIWCGGCKIHIAAGVRYNAEKKQAGTYFSTKIWHFHMRCHLCPNYIEMETDPKTRDYVITSGGSRKVETWEPGPDEGTILLPDDEESRRRAEDPFYKLEHAAADQQRAKDVAPVLEELQKFRETREDDYASSSLLRKGFRDKKKEIHLLKKEAEDLGIGTFSLLPKSETDDEDAQKAFSITRKSASETNRQKKLELKSSSIFGKGTPEQEEKRKTKIRLASKRKQLDSILKNFKPTSQKRLKIQSPLIPQAKVLSTT